MNYLGLGGAKISYWPLGGTMQSTAYLDHEHEDGVWIGFDKYSDERVVVHWWGAAWREVDTSKHG